MSAIANGNGSLLLLRALGCFKKTGMDRAFIKNVNDAAGNLASVTVVAVAAGNLGA